MIFFKLRLFNVGKLIFFNIMFNAYRSIMEFELFGKLLFFGENKFDLKKKH